MPTDYLKMAQECQAELAVVERRLEQAKEERARKRDIHNDKSIAILEDMRMELRDKIRLYRERAQAKKP